MKLLKYRAGFWPLLAVAALFFLSAPVRAGNEISALHATKYSDDGSEVTFSLHYAYDGSAGAAARLLPVIADSSQQKVSSFFGADPVTISPGSGTISVKVKFFNDDPGSPKALTTDIVRIMMLNDSGSSILTQGNFNKTIKWGEPPSAQLPEAPEQAKTGQAAGETALQKAEQEKQAAIAAAAKAKADAEAKAKEEARQHAEQERLAAEAQAKTLEQARIKAEQERVAAETRAKAEAAAAEARKKAEQDRLAAEAKAKAEADARAAEIARQQAEQERLAAQAKAEAQAKALEAARQKAEQERLAAEAKAKAAAEALAAARKHAEEEKLEAAAKARAEADAKAAEEARQKAEQERLAAEAKAKAAVEAKAAEEARQKAEQVRLAAEAKARAEAEAKAQEQARQRAKQERLAAEAKAKADAEAKAQEVARQKAEQARLAAEAKAQAEAQTRAREEAQRKAEQDRLAAEAKAKAETEARALEAARQKAEQERLATEAKARADAAMKAKAMQLARAQAPSESAPVGKSIYIGAATSRTTITNIDIVQRSMDRTQMTLGVDYNYVESDGPSKISVECVSSDDPTVSGYFASPDVDVPPHAHDTLLIPVRLGAAAGRVFNRPTLPTDKILVYMVNGAGARTRIFQATMVLLWHVPGFAARQPAAPPPPRDNASIESFQQNDPFSGYAIVKYNVEADGGRLRLRVFSSANPSSADWFGCADVPIRSGPGMQLVRVFVPPAASCPDVFKADTLEIQVLDSAGKVLATAQKADTLTWAKPK